MKAEIWQDKQKVLTQDLSRAQSTKEEAMRERLTDTFSKGVVKLSLDEFSFDITVGYTNRFTIKRGIAYNSIGERILILDDTIQYDPTLPSTESDDGLGGLKPTPQSTGSKGITATSGKVNYVFIKYLQTIDPSVYTIKKDSTEKLYVKQDDGYQITIVLSDIVVADPETLNPDSSLYIYLGFVDYSAGGTLGTGNFNLNNRTSFQLNEQRLIVTTPKSDLSDRTTSYTYSQDVDVQDHIKAVGTGSVSDRNPHGVSIADIGFTGKTVELHEKYLHSSGIVGNYVATNSSLYGIVNAITTPQIDEIIIKGLLTEEFAIINGVTIDQSVNSGNQVVQFKSGSVILDDGTYTIFLNNQTKRIELAGPTGKSFTLISGGTTYTIPVVNIRVLTLITILPLWQVDFSQAKILSNVPEVQPPAPPNGYSNFNNKIDLRIFGNINSDTLTFDSLTNTITFRKSLHITGDLTVDGVISEAYIGEVRMFANDPPNSSWIFCDGTSYHKATYPLLWIYLTKNGTDYTTWGGDASNMQVPNYNKRMPLGTGGGISLGATGGEENHTLTIPEMPAHTHLETFGFGGGVTSGLSPNIIGSVGSTGIYTGSTGNGNTHNNMPPYVGINFLIRAKL